MQRHTAMREQSMEMSDGESEVTIYDRYNIGEIGETSQEGASIDSHCFS